MPFSIYALSVPVLVRGLGVLSTYMDKASLHAADHQLDPADLFQARLAPDMYPLSGQVQRVSDNAKGGVARLAGVRAPSFEDTETTFCELKARIRRTMDFLGTVAPEALEGAEDRLIPMPSLGVTLTGGDYLLKMLLPNIFFHITTVHDILRHQGLNVGKSDYFGAL